MKEFIKHPLKTGSITPSSAFLAEKMLEHIPSDKSKFIIELGPGTGAITKHIIPKLSKDCQFLGVEINEEMIKFLETEYPDMKIAPISAENLDKYLIESGLSKATHIISGLPWAIFNEELQEAILASIVKSMREDGVFTTFAYVHALKLKTAKNFKEKLSSFFETIEMTSPIWMNIPPAIVYHCRLK